MLLKVFLTLQMDIFVFEKLIEVSVYEFSRIIYKCTNTSEI